MQQQQEGQRLIPGDTVSFVAVTETDRWKTKKQSDDGGVCRWDESLTEHEDQIFCLLSTSADALRRDRNRIYKGLLDFYVSFVLSAVTKYGNKVLKVQ